ncbi:hydroxymethylglutaryl-CoA lyase [Shouchella lonarensis]|uniref:Hydroxymethylglutaryl-CoA lyase n=1 Tax=Shouchella lonarensis TaxID=1464122 RepID=A0A1G6MM65_9BACI|nr:hydroxymethylglutaryl-CoA lyase [Shouchella lonarensis]SDC56045.1 hydroxymethylglutaryl-CoA lyase [Shouchella lonarensis]
MVICEVGVRDGLQNEPVLLTTEQKVTLLDQLAATGIKKLEAVSFVHPKLVPAMKDAEEVLANWNTPAHVIVAGLALNPTGILRALKTSIDHLHVSIAVSDAFNQKNAKRSVKEGLSQLLPATKEASAHLPVTAILATSFGCPFSGAVSQKDVLHMTESFLTAGVSHIVLGDTTGMAHPYQVKEMIHAFDRTFGQDVTLGLHFHNTRGLGLANALAGYEAGVRYFDASIGGLGGCPYAPNAVGNVCTEDLVHLFEQSNINTGIDLQSLIPIAKQVETWMGKKLPGMVMHVPKNSCTQTEA